MTDEPRVIISVGIDVGTTTTQMVLSRLSLGNAAHHGQVPRFTISEKAVLYQSPLIMTPLLDRDTIDADALSKWLQTQYQAAGVQFEQVETGAVIITGEAAKKKNADTLLQALGGLAGDFVVTVAGPNLESIIAGKGAGAPSYAQNHFCRVTNIDIGGGSANAALFRGVDVLATAGMNFGGRILEVHHGTGAIQYISKPAKIILADLEMNLSVGDLPGLDDLRRFTNRMAELTAELLEGRISNLSEKLYLTPPMPVSGSGSVLMFSGGIGEHFYNPIPIYKVSDATIYDDVGPLLAESLRQNPILRSQEVVTPAETMRATVLGASSQTVTLSGSTIWADEQQLPLKNIPVMRIGEDQLNQLRKIPPDVFLRSIQGWDLDPGSDSFALAFDFTQQLDYNELTGLAESLVEFADLNIPQQRPLIILIEKDYAQVLGQTINGLAPTRPLVVIDQVGLRQGDYIDIGNPLMDGRVVPVNVKTLVFYH